MLARLAPWIALAGALGPTPPALAQDEPIGLVATGAARASAASALESFVAIAPEHRFEVAPEVPPEAVAMLVTLDTDVPAVRVWRRRDGVTLERRFDAPQDAYALAVVASELLEVARTGADPATVGAIVIEPAPAPAPAPAPPPAPAPAPAPVPAPVPAPAPAPDAGWAVELTPGIGAEAWVATAGRPWIVQPAIFVELLAGPADEGWRIGGALFAGALGGWHDEDGGYDVSYARHDFGLRLGAGGDVGPIRTRLLGHLRVGAAAVVGAANREGLNDDRREETRPGWFVGLALDARQPLIEGLEVFLELSADVLPAPVRFTAFGETLVVEPTLRLGGRLGLAWRVR